MSAVEFIKPELLADWLLEIPDSVIVLDVRDSDYEGGKVRNSMHVPFSSFDPPAVFSAIPESVKEVVVHCHYSQMRGPSAAASLLNYIKSLLSFGNSDEKPAAEKLPFRVSVMRGGFSAWKESYYSNHLLYETLSGKLESV
jgi:Cdc25 family phosphatase